LAPSLDARDASGQLPTRTSQFPLRLVALKRSQPFFRVILTAARKFPHRPSSQKHFWQRLTKAFGPLSFHRKRKNSWFGVPIGFSDLEEIGRPAAGDGSVKA
jgi:hypothetical protein